jgi:hypothetical protein
MFGRSRRMDILYAGSGAEGRVARDPVSSNPVRRPGPPAVALARNIYADRDDVTFASLETAFRGDGADLLVRAICGRARSTDARSSRAGPAQ